MYLFPIGKWRIVDVAYIICIGLFSPFLFFYFNSFVIKKLDFRKNIFKISLCSSIITIGYFIYYQYDVKLISDFVLWQFIVALVLQLIIYENLKLTQKKNISDN